VIEEYLSRAAEAVRPLLLAELVRSELKCRCLLGERPAAGEYASRFPACAGSIADWFAQARASADQSRASGPSGADIAGLSSTGMLPKVLGRYELLEPLGAGGMGKVYKARHQKLGKLVALKLLRGHAHPSPEALARFLREMKAAGRLGHPNIVPAYDAGEVNGIHFFVMEYIEGEDLARLVKRRGPLPVGLACDCVRQAALGLQHAFERGLVHRDIKPHNLLLTREGVVKILDMGLARLDEVRGLHKESITTLTPDGAVIGTADYIAPEQVLNSHTADTRADLYSLGCTLYHLLAGRAPFRGRTTLQKLLWHQMRPPRPVRELRPEVPEGLAAVLDRVMAKDPAQRYQTPAELAQALVPWTQTPVPPPPPEEMPKQLTPRRDASPAKSLPGSPTPSPAEGENGATPSGSRSVSAPIRPEAAAPSAGPAPRSLSARPPQKTAGAPQRNLLPWAGKDRRVGALVGAVLLTAVAVGFAVSRRNSSTVPPPSPGRPGNAPPAVADSTPPLGLLVPAYFDPVGDGLAQWDRLLDSPAAAVTVAVANPASGPGVAIDPNYAQVLERARRKGVTVLGYVSTNYAERSLDKVMDDVDRWVSFYPEVQGIFFDQQASAAEKIGYYTDLYQHVRGKHRLGLVVTNPGTACAEEYLARPATDAACLAEPLMGVPKYHPPDWAGRYPADRFVVLATKVVTPEQMRGHILEAVGKRVGYCYVTDGNVPNPWGRLPSYWEQEALAVRQVNAR
jgi:serine/threonine protein kinase